MLPSVVERFLRYVTVDTQSAERSSASPSTPGQVELLEQLAAELQGLGLTDAAMSEHGVVMATVPATSSRTDVPVIGFIAHVDTSPDMPGRDVRPLVHRAYDGRDLVLPDHPSAVLRAADHANLARVIGHDLITASGSTLLGADDKAGVAEIVTAVEYLMTHPGIPHGPVRIAFTPDEEIGRGTAHFDLERFGAEWAYTVDGGERGELETETFSADTMTLTFHGFNTHPGYAKGRLINAIKMAADFIALLPKGISPEGTDGYEGYVHPHVVDAGVDRTVVRVLVRDFETAKLKEKEALLEALARQAIAAYQGGSLEVGVEESYRNMREVLDRHPVVVERAKDAMRRAGIEPIMRPIRGGTDGARLSHLGLPTPNLFAGQHNIHSRLEWISVQDMEAAVEVIVHLCRVWEERTPPAAGPR